MNATKKPVDVTVREHPAGRPGYTPWLAIVTTSQGRSYFASWADGDRPTDEQVRQAWTDDRHSFAPYKGY